jgi:hypothetical protein
MKENVTLTQLIISRTGPYNMKIGRVKSIQSICERNKEIESFFNHFKMFGKVYEHRVLDIHFRFIII